MSWLIVIAVSVLFVLVSTPIIVALAFKSIHEDIFNLKSVLAHNHFLDVNELRQELISVRDSAYILQESIGRLEAAIWDLGTVDYDTQSTDPWIEENEFMFAVDAAANEMQFLPAEAATAVDPEDDRITLTLPKHMADEFAGFMLDKAMGKR
jgi:hypothetical protein